jgi:hypothetical protein
VELYAKKSTGHCFRTQKKKQRNQLEETGNRRSVQEGLIVEKRKRQRERKKESLEDASSSENA